jgi:DNA-binding response OmpR family regulator
MKILLVNDQDLFTNTFAYLLRKWDHQVEVAHRVRSAGLLLDQQEFDVAIVDWWMKEPGSADLMARAKASGAFVILLTAHINPPPNSSGVYDQFLGFGPHLEDRLSVALEKAHRNRK